MRNVRLCGRRSSTRRRAPDALRVTDDLVRKLQPSVLPFIPGGLRRRRKVRVRERADRDADHRWKTLRLPPHRRSACAAEMEGDGGAAVGSSPELG